LFFFFHIQYYVFSSRYGLGDIAIDDISLSDSCPTEERLCTFEDPIMCKYVNDPLTQYQWIHTTGLDQVCTFEDPIMCKYVNDPLTQYQWIHTTGLDQVVSDAKPSVDHTDGTTFGAYAMVDISKSSSNNTDQRARLISPTITPNGEQCVEFWYYSDGDLLTSSSKLNVLVRANSEQSNSSNYLIWSKSLPQVNSFESRFFAFY